MGSGSSSMADQPAQGPARAAVAEWRKAEEARECIVKQQLMAAIDAGKVCGHRKLCLKIPNDITQREMQHNLRTLLEEKGWPCVGRWETKYATTDTVSEKVFAHVTVDFIG